MFERLTLRFFQTSLLLFQTSSIGPKLHQTQKGIAEKDDRQNRKILFIL